jgi:hypothetical protein
VIPVQGWTSTCNWDHSEPAPTGTRHAGWMVCGQENTFSLYYCRIGNHGGYLCADHPHVIYLPYNHQSPTLHPYYHTYVSYGAFTLDVNSVLNENLDGILRGT